jgi:pimeloyl-ACP methyl ester carboxylesterase
MNTSPDVVSDGVLQHHTTLAEIPVTVWTPTGAEGLRHLVLLAHGGGQHAMAPAVLSRARRLVTAYGFAALAIDAPGHGSRPPTNVDEQFRSNLKVALTAGDDVSPIVAEYNSAIAGRAIPEWRAVLDALGSLQRVAQDAAVGFWGLSLGAAIGLPLLVAEDRIQAAIFGLVGGDHLAAVARQVRVPVSFLMQWDDELVPRPAALALFDALGAPLKTLHANPGRHAEVPRYEHEDAAAFLGRHLSQPAPTA